MAGQFLLNLFIALLWVFLKDQNDFYFTTFGHGFIVGIFIVFLMSRFFAGQVYLISLYYIIKLHFLFISEFLQSSVDVIRHILIPKINIEPSIFTYKAVLKSDWEVTTIALLL